jgi:four helix bundle suffix protein
MKTKFRARQSDTSDRSDLYSFRTAPAPIFANTMLCLINQATWLLNRQIQKLEQHFINEGGFTERLYRVRTQARKNQCNEKRKR